MKPLCLSLLAACCLAGTVPQTAAQSAKPAPQQRMLQAQIPTQNLKTISLDAGDGKARFVVGNGDGIRVQVQVSPQPPGKRDVGEVIGSWFLSSAYDTPAELVQAVRLQSRITGDRLEIGLTPSTRSRRQRLKEEWTIEVPKRMALALNLGAADLDVTGVAGGIEADIGVGRAKVQVPTGNVALTIGVGNAVVRTGGDSIGKVTLSSSVGRTHLWMNGLQIQNNDPPGSGSKVSLEGEGSHTIKVAVSVGDAEVRVR